MSARVRLLGMALLPLFACSPADPTLDEVSQRDTPVTVPELVYSIKSVISGKCAAVSGGSQAQGASVVQRDCDGGASSLWQLQRLSDATYQLVAQHSGQCLAVVTNSSQNGQQIVQSRCAAAANQKWLLADASGAFLVKPQTSGASNRKCMDVTQSSKANGAQLIQWSCHGLDNQRWILAPLGGGMDGGTTDGGGGTGGPPPGGGTVSYTVDNTTIFANPERGFYHHEETDGSNPLSQSQLSAYRTGEAISLILRLFYLDSFRSANISASYLAGISTDFDRVRAAGLKAVVRFAYTSSMSKPYGDASRDRVLGHLAQLKPILQANADIIATLQVGLVGAWGEWYYTDYFGDQGSVSAAQWDDRKAVVEALLAILPSTRTVQLRTPAFKQRFYGASALTSSEAFAATSKARVGHHNDCFLASADDEGTYGNATADKSYLAAENLFVPQGGETCATSSFTGWANASADMERLHYSYLNRDYLGAVYTGWGSNVDIARRRLGYRLALVDGTFDGGARPGGELKVSLGLRNDGYAPPYNPRSVEIIARNQSTGARLVAKLPADPRRFVPGASQRIDVRLCVPAGAAEGTYALSLALPDPEPALHNRPEYAIRLANTGLWDATTGANSLQRTITISANSTSPPCSAGSVALSP